MKIFDGKSTPLLLLGALLLTASVESEAAGYRKPKNPRRRRKPAAAIGAPAAPAPEAAGEAPASSSGTAARPAAQPPEDLSTLQGLPEGLKPRRWSPKARALLEEAILAYGKRSKSYDPEQPPLAVLPWDRAAFDGDIGEAMFRRLVSRAEFKFNDDFWKEVPLAFGRQRIRAAYEQFAGAPRSTWENHPVYHQYRKAFLRSYTEACAQIGRKDCRLYLVRLLRGFTPDEAIDYSRRAMGDELVESGEELIGESPSDPFPLRVRRGMRPVPEFEDLVALLQKEGFQLLVADLDAQPLLEASLAEYGIPPKCAFGIRQEVKREKFSGTLVEPVPFRGGKAEGVVRTGRQLVIAIGSSADDVDLLSHGDGARIMLDSDLDEETRAEAKRRGWVLQPAFVRQ